MTSSDRAGVEFLPSHIISGHDRSVSALKYSPDGKYLASSSADATCKVWDVAAGYQLVHSFEGHSRGLSDVAWSPDSTHLATASDEGLVKVWSLNAVPPQIYLVFGDLDRTFWQKSLVWTLEGHTNYVFCVCFHPTGNVLASGSFDESIRLWDISQGTCIRTMPAHSDPVTGLDFSPDGTLLVSSSYDGLMRLWDTCSGRCLKTLVDNDNPPVYQCSYFAVFSVFNARNSIFPRTSVKFSPNGKYILAGSLDHAVRLWSHQTGRCVKTFEGHQNIKYCCFPSFLTLPDGTGHVVLSGSEDGRLYAWDMNSKVIIGTFKGYEGPLVALSIAPDCQHIATASLEPNLQIRILSVDLKKLQ